MIGLIGMFIFLWHQPCTWSSMSDLKKHSDEQRTLSLTFDLRVMVNQERFQPSQASNEFSNAAPMRASPGISMACIMTSPKHKRTVTGVLAETWGSRAWPSWIVLGSRKLAQDGDLRSFGSNQCRSRLDGESMGHSGVKFHAKVATVSAIAGGQLWPTDLLGLNVVDWRDSSNQNSETTIETFLISNRKLCRRGLWCRASQPLLNATAALPRIKRTARIRGMIEMRNIAFVRMRTAVHCTIRVIILSL